MNFKNLNEAFENKFSVSRSLLREEQEQEKSRQLSKKRFLESIDRTLTEKHWKFTIPGTFRNAIFDAGDEEDYEGVRQALVSICEYVVDNIKESEFDADEQEEIAEEFADFIEELEYMDFEDEDEANYYLNDLYDLLDNTDIFLGLRESLREAVEDEDLEETYRLAIIDWLYDHDQARRDIEARTGVGIEYLSLLGLKAIISEYDQLARDFEAYFNDSLDESLNEDESDGQIDSAIKEKVIKKFNQEIAKSDIDHSIDEDGYGFHITRKDGSKLSYDASTGKFEFIPAKKFGENLKEAHKVTGGSMPPKDVDLIRPLIDDLDRIEDTNKDGFFITWNFGRRLSDNRMTAGIDVSVYRNWGGSEEDLNIQLEALEDAIKKNGFTFDDSLGYDTEHWRKHAFGNGYHTQIIEDAEEVVEESFGYKPSFDEWYFQETGVNTSDLTDEQYDELWADEDLMDHYRKFCDSLDESLNEEYLYRSMDALHELDREIEDYLNQNNFHGFIDLYDISPNDEPVPSITYHINGDWKHEHLRFKYLVKEFLNSKNIVYMMTEREYPSDSDSYEADYTIHLMKHEDDVDESIDTVSGGKYWEPGAEDANDDLDSTIDNYRGEEPPFESLNESLPEEIKKDIDRIVKTHGAHNIPKWQIQSIAQDNPNYSKEIWRYVSDLECPDNGINEQLESGYYPSEWDTDFEDELENLEIEPQRGVYVGYQYRVPNRRLASKMVKLAKEFGYDDSWVEGNTLYLKWRRPEKEYHKSPYDECLTEERKPKYWNSMFAKKVIGAYEKGDLTFDNIKEWDKNYNGGTAPNPPFNTGEILKYYLNHSKNLSEDTVKQNGKWVNKGKEGTHGTFRTKKEADAQRRAMFAHNFKG